MHSHVLVKRKRDVKNKWRIHWWSIILDSNFYLLMLYVTLIVLSWWSILVQAMSGLPFLCLLCNWRIFAILKSAHMYTYTYAITKTLPQGYHTAGTCTWIPNTANSNKFSVCLWLRIWADINYTFKPELSST